MKWIDIPGFANRYRISDEGEVHRKAFKGLVGLPTSKSGLTLRHYPEYTLVQKRTLNGPIVILINEDNRRLHMNLDYLVLSSFRGVEPFSYVHHLDGDCYNNHLSNLQWRNDAIIESKPCKYKKKLTPAEVEKAFMDERELVVVAREIGISPLAVKLIKQRVIWEHYTRHLDRYQCPTRKKPIIAFEPEIQLEPCDD